MALGKIKLALLTFIGSIVIAAPVYAAEQIKTIFDVLTEMEVDPNVVMAMFLFLLLWGLFSMALDVLKSKMGVQNPYLVYMIAGTLAAAGTYFGYQDPLIWGWWKSLFTGGIFIMAVVMVAAVILLIASFFWGGMAVFREKRKESLEHVADIEEKKEKVLVARAKRLAKEEEYRMGYVDRALRQVSRVIPSVAKYVTDPIRAQQILKAEVPAILKRLKLAHTEVRAAIAEVKIEDKDIKYAAKRVTKTIRKWQKVTNLSKKAAEKAGAETNEIRDLRVAQSLLNKVWRRGIKVKKILPKLDRLIKDAEAEIKAATKLKKNPTAARARWEEAETIVNKAIGMTDVVIKYTDWRRRVDQKVERALNQADWLAVNIRKGEEHPRVVREKEAIALEKKIVKQLKQMVKKAPARSQASVWLKKAERAIIRAELTTNLLKKLEKLKLSFANIKLVKLKSLQKYKDAVLNEEKELNRIITEMRKR